MVLAENTAERAVGEENGTGTGAPADAGFFPEMQRGTGQLRECAGTAKTASFEAVLIF